MLSDAVSIDLKERTAQVWGAIHPVEYAFIHPDLTIGEQSDGLRAWFSDPTLASDEAPLSDAFWEFVGIEPSLQAILAGDETSFSLNNASRAKPNSDELSYLSFHVTAANPKKPQDGLLLLVQDSALVGKLQQELVQERNELRLIRGKLSRANEELEHVSQMKSLFLSMAAHDLSSPLSAIQGYADLLRVEIADNTVHKTHLQTISSQAAWLGRMIKNLLDLDRINQGKLLLDIAICDLNEIILSALEINRLSISFKEMIAVPNLNSTPVYAVVDRERVLQSLNNLITNAIKYSWVGSEIVVKSFVSEDEAAIQVIDYGRGIPNENLPHIFDIYYRTDEAEKTTIGGAGLGLHIVKRLIEAHDGRVTAESVIKIGSTFTIYLPRAHTP